MSDIVERLRGPSPLHWEAKEAADEITRLRNELHIAQEWSARVIAGHEQDIAEITALRAENERLKTSGIAEVAAHNPSVMDYMRHWEGRAEKAEAENGRLRAALREYECHCPTSVCEWFPCGKTARAALEEETSA